jgi:hypothetical protein
MLASSRISGKHYVRRSNRGRESILNLNHANKYLFLRIDLRTE